MGEINTHQSIINVIGCFFRGLRKPRTKNNGDPQESSLGEKKDRYFSDSSHEDDETSMSRYLESLDERKE